jgi:transposase-like protein
MGRTSRFSPEVRERAVRMVLEHGEQYESRWAAVKSIAEKIGCSATLTWVAWYNGSRLHESLGYLSPSRFEQVFHDRQTAPVAATTLT